MRRRYPVGQMPSAVLGKRWQVTRQAVFARYGRTCHVCGEPATEIDHLVPINVGGDDSLENLRPSCASCKRGWR